MNSNIRTQQDENADKAIKAMITAAVGVAVVPVYVNWALTASVLGSGVVAIGLCYGVELTKDEAWKLVKQFIFAAGSFFLAANVGSKFIAMVLQKVMSIKEKLCLVILTILTIYKELMDIIIPMSLFHGLLKKYSHQDFTDRY